MNKKIIFALAMALLLIAIPLSSVSASAKASSLLNYNISVTTTGQGDLYWTHGKNMEFFLCNGDDSYNQNCKIKNKTNYKFSRLIERGIVPKAADGWYFDGFYTRVGSKLNPDVYNIDVLRITVKGLYYYDYVLSLDNPKYKHYSKKRYEDMIKAYLKSAYGTTRCKKLFTTKMYQFTAKDSEIYSKFKAKVPRDFKTINDMIKTIGDSPFPLSSPDSAIEGLKFKSSNSRVISIKKNTSIATVKGEGKATITISAPEADTTLASTVKYVIRVYPVKVDLISATKSLKDVKIKWETDLKSSGYELQLSAKSAMTDIYNKTITSGKTSTTKVSLTKKADYGYVRIRAYKKSAGEKLYGPWSSVTKIN